jgi:uncharacterized protein (TIGR03083 family)
MDRDMPDETKMPAPATKAELLDRIDQAWRDLQATIESLQPEQLTTPTDAAGWSVKDHLAHLAAWERAMVFLLNDRPQWEGAGLSQEDYFSPDIDAINEVIRQRTLDTPPDDVLQDLEQTNSNLLQRIREIPEDRLQLPYSQFITGHPGRPGSDEPTIIATLSEDTWQAFDEHRTYIERIVS